MPTTVGILTFISRINTVSEGFKVSTIVIFQHFTVYEHLKFHVQLSWERKSLYNLGARICRLVSVFVACMQSHEVQLKLKKSSSFE